MNAGILTKRITIDQQYVYVTLMTLRRSLVQRSRSQKRRSDTRRRFTVVFIYFV